MQFYGFLKELVNLIPDGSGAVRAAFSAFLPYFLMASALFTAFFALKCATWWCGLTFFILGSTFSSRLLLPNYNIYDFEFWLFFGVSIAFGIVCAALSKYLFRAQLGISSFMTIMAALPDFTTHIGKTFANVVSALVAAAFVYLFVKYRYLITIATTSFTGSFILWDVIDDMHHVPVKLLWAILTGIFAFFSQALINHEHLEETYLQLRYKFLKTGKDIVKLEEKIEHHKHPETAEEAAEEATETPADTTTPQTENGEITKADRQNTDSETELSQST